ncbi:MAG: HD domain-containing protein [Lachnospiraceae bacterium]
MEKATTFTPINAGQIIEVISSTLRLIDERLLDHGERVAYIVYEMIQQGHLQDKIELDKAVLLAIFHDIGAYKTEEMDHMFQFESTNVWEHSIYGYLFIKHMTPLKSYAEGVLYHHLNHEYLRSIDTQYQEYAAILHVADRVDVLYEQTHSKEFFERLILAKGEKLSPQYVDLFFETLEHGPLEANLSSGKWKQILREQISQMNIAESELTDYLKMLVYSIDFRSEHTVTHTINTTAISVELAKRLGLSAEEIDTIYLGALLHDLGKIAIPIEILEFAGKLTDQEMDIMRTHVKITEQIIKGVVPEIIAHISIRHHEKLDGSGYPYGLCESDLTVPEQIVAVADIVSALTSRRSYKEEFPKEKTLHIIKELSDGGKLSKRVCQMLVEDYDGIMNNTDMSRDPIIQMYQEMSVEFKDMLEYVKKWSNRSGKS